MEKNIFYETVKEGVLENLNMEGLNVTATLKDVKKNNGLELKGLSFMGEDKVQPVVYLDSFYAEYESGHLDLGEVIDKVTNAYHNSNAGATFDIDSILDYEKVKDKLTVVVRNAEMNDAQLETVPHEVHEDLAEMYRIEVDNVDGVTGSVLVTNDMLKHFGVDEETLKKDAWDSMKVNHPGQMKNMFDVLNEIYKDKFGEDMPADMMEVMGAGRPRMYVYSNDDKMNGAVYMLDKEDMGKVAEEFGESFAVLPSSIHEVIILPESVVDDYESLKSMVEEVNATQVSLDEKLSDNVYRFDMDTQELSLYNGQSESMDMKM